MTEISGRSGGKKPEDDRGPSISTRFLWVLLAVMILMVAMPLLPVMPRSLVAGVMMLWLVYELWRLVYRGRGSG